MFVYSNVCHHSLADHFCLNISETNRLLNSFRRYSGWYSSSNQTASCGSVEILVEKIFATN